MAQTQAPTREEDVADIIRKVGDARVSLETVGAGTKRAIGRPTQHAVQVTTRNMRGITLYEPNELVVSALAGTPLSVLETELAKNNQQLAFEPIDLGRASGASPTENADAAGGPTIGGIVATNAAGARRVYAGAARDHVLGIRAVNGRGEIFKSGGRVMKNVTGYDITKAMTGSWGTLSVLTEVTLKVLPTPEETATLIVCGLSDEMASEVMCSAMGLPYEVSGAVHLQSDMARRLDHAAVGGADAALAAVLNGAATALRIENVSSSVSYRMEQLRRRFSAFGEVVELDTPSSLAFWRKLRDLAYLQVGEGAVWRISTAPTSGPRIVRMISEFMPVRAAYDWSGGLIWLEVPEVADAGAAEIRRVVATVGGHATLMRAAPSVRAAVDVFQPLEAGLMRLTRGVKAAYDPAAVLNPGRMYADV
ncbi:MAG: FAD-binding protein [Pseudomonadota bacterium]